VCSSVLEYTVILFLLTDLSSTFKRLYKSCKLDLLGQQPGDGKTVIRLLKFFQFNCNQVEARTIFQLLNVYKQQPLTRWWLGRYFSYIVYYKRWVICNLIYISIRAPIWWPLPTLAPNSDNNTIWRPLYWPLLNMANIYIRLPYRPLYDDPCIGPYK
jgi:hypothetical protein